MQGSFRWPPPSKPRATATPLYMDPARPAFLMHSETINNANR